MSETVNDSPDEDLDAQDALNSACEGLAKLGLLPVDAAPAVGANADAEVVYAALRERASAKIESFYAESIEEDDDYAKLLDALVNKAGLTARISGVTSSFDLEERRARIACVVDGEPSSKEFAQPDAYVAKAFLRYVRETFEELGVHVVSLPAEDEQDMALLLLSGDGARDTADHLRRSQGEGALTKETSQAVAATLIISVIGLIVTTAIGAFLIGFWISLGLSVLFWTFFALKRAVRAVKEQSQAEKEFEELAEQDPAGAGRLVMEQLKQQFPEEAAKGAELAKRMQAKTEKVN